MPGHLTIGVPLIVAHHKPGSVCTIMTVTCLCLAVACQQLWQHVGSCAHTCQPPTEPFAHCQAPACDDCNAHSSGLPKEGTCSHAAGPATTYTLAIILAIVLSIFYNCEASMCLRRNAMCYLQLLGLAGSCRLFLLLVCIMFSLLELLNEGLHVSTQQ